MSQLGLIVIQDNVIIAKALTPRLVFIASARSIRDGPLDSGLRLDQQAKAFLHRDQPLPEVQQLSHARQQRFHARAHEGSEGVSEMGSDNGVDFASDDGSEFGFKFRAEHTGSKATVGRDKGERHRCPREVIEPLA